MRKQFSSLRISHREVGGGALGEKGIPPLGRKETHLGFFPFWLGEEGGGDP